MDETPQKTGVSDSLYDINSSLLDDALIKDFRLTLRDHTP